MRITRFIFVAMVLALMAVPMPTQHLGVSDASAQVAQEDVIYLKNGDIIRGTIIEQVFGVSIRVRHRDGTERTYKYADIDKTAREPMVGSQQVVSAGFGGLMVQPAGYKDPGSATLYGVLCAGCGHLWAGETKKGAIMLGVAVGAPIVGAAMTSCDLGGCSTAPFTLGIVAALTSWGYSIYDAGAAARRTNTMNGFASTLERIQVGAGPGGGAQVGLSIPTNW